MLLQIYVAKIHVATDTCCYRYLLLQVLLLPMSNVLYFYTSTSRSVVFPVGKGDRYVRLTTLPPSCAVVMKSGNLSILEPSGPFQACNGTALPLPLLPAVYVQCPMWLFSVVPWFLSLPLRCADICGKALRWFQLPLLLVLLLVLLLLLLHLSLFIIEETCHREVWGREGAPPHILYLISK